MTLTQMLSRALIAQCHGCPAGTFNAQGGSLVGGQHVLNNVCEQCPPGKFSLPGSAECQQCAKVCGWSSGTNKRTCSILYTYVEHNINIIYLLVRQMTPMRGQNLRLSWLVLQILWRRIVCQ
jgi:hypothetical protein